MWTRTRTITACATVAVAGLAAGITLPATAVTPAPKGAAVTPTWHQGRVVYQSKIVFQDIVLGPQSDATTLISTRELPAGTYLVTAIVGAVLASHDQIVCAAFNDVHHNDGVFGTAGNSGTGFIYGTATMTDTVQVTAGQRLSVTCNSFAYGKGTYAATAVIEAVPVAYVR